MTYLGKFACVYTQNYNRNWGYSNTKKYIFLKNCPERLFFAIDKGKDGYKIVNYPITNKVVVELYKAGDRGLTPINEKFTKTEIYLDMIRFINHTKRDKYFWGYEYKDYSTKSTYDLLPKQYSEDALYITDTKTDWKNKALEFANKNLIINGDISTTMELAREKYNKR
jgi:hypothetical protein